MTSHQHITQTEVPFLRARFMITLCAITCSNEEVLFTMKHRIIMGALTFAILASATVVAGDALKSGPAVGKNIPGPFHPLNVTGDKAGEKHCLV
jgi:hypothetical protein